MNKGNPYLSIIIPVYNVEKYLRQCIDSVLDQHLCDYEVILVDDGSPDRSPQICDEYASSYSEITVIHQSNKGASEARNAGIKASRGTYLMFMDSDDWWNPEVSVNGIVKRIQSGKESDMYLFTSIDYIDGVGYYKRKEHNNLDQIRTQKVEDYYQDLLLNGNLEVSACTKVLNREFILDNDLLFVEGLTGEDNQWMIRLLRKLRTVEIINEPLYICRISRNDSVTHTIKKKNIEDLLKIVEESISYYQMRQSNERIKKLEFCFCAYLWFCALGLSQRLSKEEQRRLLPKFKSTDMVCRYSNSSKTRVAYFVSRVFGVKVTSFILGKYIGLKNMINFNKRKIAV